MKLILSKKQETKGMMGGKIVYQLTVKADLTEEEKSNLTKYGMADTVLYSDVEGNPSETIWKSLKTIATSTVINVSNLAYGRTIECKSFMEIINVEQEVITACHNLKNILDAMVNFEGEKIIKIE